MSTFGGLNTAYTGLVAARQGLDVVGQNIANANTDGYTRQRVSTSAVGPTIRAGLFTGGVRSGQGVSVDGIARLGSAQLDAQVRSSAASGGYSAVRANALSALENSLNEPGESGLSAQLQEFWAGWQDLSNHTDEPAPAALLLATAGALTIQIAQGYQAVTAQWSDVRSDVDGMVAELNGAASLVAKLNSRIRSTLASGGSANELLDQRNTLSETIAALTGATVRELSDGTVDVLIGGNALVSGDTVQLLKVSGAARLGGAGGGVTLEWVNRPATPVSVDGGEIAGALSLLAPATSGGALAAAAASYDAFALDLAAQVNTIYVKGATVGGTTGVNFFEFDAMLPPAMGLTVVPTSGADVATGDPARGAYDGSIADAIAQLSAGGTVDEFGNIVESPNTVWSTFVTTLGVATKSEMQHATLADLAATSALNRQLANSSVDLDEENVNLLMYQHAYQGAARVMTAVDEMLDTLINRTGLVGR